MGLYNIKAAEKFLRRVFLFHHSYHVGSDFGKASRTAHHHCVAKLISILIYKGLNTFISSAVNSSYEGSCDDNGISAECNCLKNINACTDAAVNENFCAASLQRLNDFGKNLSGCGALIKNSATMIGNKNTISSCLCSLYSRSIPPRSKTTVT